MVALQGVWFGIYPASGIELIELRYDSSNSMLTGRKLTGNQYVRAGRASFEVTQNSCRVVSSMWAGVFTPRWDPCVGLPSLQQASAHQGRMVPQMPSDDHQLGQNERDTFGGRR